MRHSHWGAAVLFPDFTRVVYGKNPLTTVSFQANFGRLLEIDTVLPANFQKGIIAEYPLLEERDVYRITIEQRPNEPVSTPTDSKGRIYDFLSSDKTWKVTLASDYIALSTSKYEKWEAFQGKLRIVLEQFFLAYTVPLFVRIGLRYQNVIDRDKLGLETVPWHDLLRPHIAGEFGDTSIPEDKYTSRQASFRLNLGDKDFALVTHGLVRNRTTNQLGYRLEGDYSNIAPGGAEIDATLNTAYRLNGYSGRVFRWAITDRLHEAMEPMERRATG
jgi:uncharacterized protein (TIGR04255 family)